MWDNEEDIDDRAALILGTILVPIILVVVLVFAILIFGIWSVVGVALLILIGIIGFKILFS